MNETLRGFGQRGTMGNAEAKPVSVAAISTRENIVLDRQRPRSPGIPVRKEYALLFICVCRHVEQHLTGNDRQGQTASG